MALKVKGDLDEKFKESNKANITRKQKYSGQSEADFNCTTSITNQMVKQGHKNQLSSIVIQSTFAKEILLNG